MGHFLENIHEIFYLQYRPWLISYSEFKFQQELTRLEDIMVDEAPFFEVDYPKSLNSKRKFFRKLIDNECIRFLNRLTLDVQDRNPELLNRYHVHYALNVILAGKLRYAADILDIKKYEPSQYERQGITISCSNPHADDSYIIHYAKHQLVRLFLEVQKRYPLLINLDLLTEDDVYNKFFDHSTTGHIRELAAEAEAPQAVDQPLPAAVAGFVPCTGDFRPPKKGVRSFGETVKNSLKFARLEQEFFDSGYVDSAYQFVHKRGSKKEMAMIVCYAIRKGYFNKKIKSINREIKPLDIRKFIEYRFNMNIEQEFRIALLNPSMTDQFVARHYWLDHLPSC